MLRKPDPSEHSDKSPTSEAISSTALIQSRVGRDLMSSTVAGIFTAYGSFPAESYKKYIQSSQTGRFHPYRGSTIFAVNIIPTTAIQLTTDGYLHTFMQKDAPHSHKIAASFYCGVQGAILATVVENCILHQQLHKLGPTSTMLKMIKHSPLRPWKSFSMIAMRDGIFTSYMLWAGKETEEYAKRIMPASYTPIAKFAVSILGTAISQPFDVIGTHMQKTDNKISIIDATKQVMQANNYKNIFAGFIPRLFMFYTFGTFVPFIKEHVDDILDHPERAREKISECKNNIYGLFKTSSSDRSTINDKPADTNQKNVLENPQLKK